MTLPQRTIKLIVAYDGSGFYGFQLQPGVPTIQGELEKAVAGICDEAVRVNGSGRTDTGVHALGQVASIQTCCPIPVEKFIVSMNRCLPGSIRVKSMEEVSPDFHARFSAKGKHYRYLTQSVSEPSPFLERFFCQVTESLDLESMREGAKRFLGKHDFGSFTKSPEKQGDTAREILESTVGKEGNTFVFDVIGNGFLHNMVRNMARTLVLIGSHQMAPDEISELYRNQDRRRIGAPAPPGGLYLMRVLY